MRKQSVFIFLLGGLLVLGSSVWQTSGKRYVPSSEAATLTNLNVPVKAFVTTFPSPTKQDRPQSEDALWQDVDVAITRAVQLQEPNWIKPLEYRSVALNEGALAGVLNRAPLEFSPEFLTNRAIMTFPMPDGSFQRFAIVESPVMGPELAAAWTHIRTYAGQGIDDPTATVRFDISPVGLRAMILSADETVFIDPAKRGGTNLYLSYFKRNYLNAEKEAFACEIPSPEPDLPDLDHHRLSVTPKALPAENPIRLRTYRLVVCANAEYGNAAGGGVLANAQAAVVTTVNRVTGLYERDLAVRLNLVHAYVFVGTTTADPFTDGANTNAGTAWVENTAYINTNWGDANYDIGHFFSTGAGGAGDIGQVCVTGRKANGATGQGSPTGDAYDIDYVAHEIGHQFGGRHTFNSGGPGGCAAGTRDTTGPLPNTVEPGSGTTIMAYAGICGNQDLQLVGQGEGPNGQVLTGASDDYFHSTSIERINDNITTGTSTCGVQTVTANNRPAVDAGANFTIPVSTPFTLTAASGSDPDSNPITYCWEEMDQGTAITSGSVPNPDLGDNAIFRSWQPAVSPSRTFPELSVILNDPTKETRPGRYAKSLIGEVLPTTSRTMTFRCTVRDNQSGGGGVNWDSMTVTSSAGAGPFVVTAPAASVCWPNNVAQTVTWNVANTNNAPVSCSNVKITLSTDGGVTFPTVLMASTANDGSEAVTIPAGTTSAQARIKVEAVGNIFFDISDNFSLNQPPTITPTPVTVDAGESVMDVQIATVSDLEDAAGTLTVTTVGMLPAGVTITDIQNTNGTISADVAADCTATVGAKNITLRATDSCSGTADTTLVVTVRKSPPTITASPTISRQQGTLATVPVTIATIGDTETPIASLIFTVTQPMGIQITNVAINPGTGVVQAEVLAACTATLGDNLVTLEVQDGCAQTATATLTVNVTANVPPTLGNYLNTTVIWEGNVVVTPDAAPSDNGMTASVTVTATPMPPTPYAFTGVLMVDQITGVVTITNAGLPGIYLVTITATDNCGDSSQATFLLNVISVELSNLYVPDTMNNRVQRFDGVTWSTLGTGTVGSGNGQFHSPEAVTTDFIEQVIYVADTGNNRIQWFVAGSGWSNFAMTGSGLNQVRAPQGVALDQAGNLYVSDTGNGRVLRFNGGNPGNAVVLATTGSGSGQVRNPRGLAIDLNFNLYVVDQLNQRILKIAGADMVTAANTGTTLVTMGTGPSQVRSPEGITVDNNGHVYVADTANNRVVQYANGNPATPTVWCQIGASPGQVRGPEGVAVTRFLIGPMIGHSLSVADTMNNRVQSRLLAGATWTIWGNSGSALGQFKSPGKLR